MHPLPSHRPAVFSWAMALLLGALSLLDLATARLAIGNTGAATFAGDAQHTAVYTPAAQNLNAMHWTTPIDLNTSGAFAHYGAPLITAANTILVPVKTATNGFEVHVFDAALGTPKYTLTTDYILPSHNWIPSYQPALSTGAFGTRLYYPGAGGTIYYIDNPDSTSHGAPVHQVFYTTLANYQANAAGFNATVFINTPITADSTGNVFFGFRVQGTAPAPLNTTQSGLARIDPNGNATFVLAGTAANDPNIARDTHNSGPAVSNDQATVYVVVKAANTATYGYLLGLDATTLATKFKVFLKDPRNNHAQNATILDDSTASPMVAPDNDVYLGIFGNPDNGSRGFLLRFSSDLSVEKPAGGFGWDNTPAIVPATMVPSYTGSSSYLIFTKYNNYANAGSDSGDGVNRIALLDPNATQVDAHSSSNGLLIMREVLTVIGPTADPENRSASLPNAVREWCINTAAINPATQSIFTPSEDGHVYRWNLASNSLTQSKQLTPGIGEPYVPTVIGPDGTVFTLNGGTLFALGSLNGVGITVTSSSPDVRDVVTGQTLTFTAMITNTGASGNIPTGTVTFEDTVYFVPSPDVLDSTTTVLAANVPLDGTGQASYTSAAFTADKHFITASYSGDAHFSPGTATVVQTVHASASATTLAASPNPSNVGQTVTCTATVASSPAGGGIPTGMVTFQAGNTVLAQVPVNVSGVASFSTAALAPGSHTMTATYASDTRFAASSGTVGQQVQGLVATTTTVSSSPNPSTVGQAVTFTATVTSGSGVPSGSVTFAEGAIVWASNVPVDGAGHASFSTAALAAGSHTITATFTGASSWANSSGSDAAAPQVVNKGATTVNRDFNGDGRSDILWRNTTSGLVYLWLMNGTSVSGQGGVGSASSDWQIVGVGDFNGDGRSDILWRNTTSGLVYLWLMNGTSVSSQGGVGSASSDGQIVGVGDFSGDGMADILWRNTTSGLVYLWLMNGTSMSGQGGVGSASSDWQIVGVGDFNGDGMADILWRNTTSGLVYLWLMNGTSVSGQGGVGSASSDWQIVGVGDFNGDGMADILWRNTTSGLVYLWLMNGTSVSGQGGVGSASSDWQIVGVGDFNGDGMADILWRNTTSGLVYLWLMNGTSVSGQGGVGSASSDWQLQ